MHVVAERFGGEKFDDDMAAPEAASSEIRDPATSEGSESVP